MMIFLKRAFESNIFLFVIFAIGFFLWRVGGPLVWDDTNTYKLVVNHGIIGNKLVFWDSLVFHIKQFPLYFGYLDTSGYRPIANYYQSISLYSIKSIYPNVGLLTFISLLFGSLAVLYKNVASHFLKSKLVIFFCLILFVFAGPFIASNWILHTGIPSLVPFLILLGISLYFKIIEKPKFRSIYIFLFVMTLFIAPLYREFMIMLPLTILGMEIIRTKKFTLITLLCLILVLHSLFPTFVFHFIFPQLPIKSVFNLGLLNGQLSNSIPIRTQVSPNFLSIISPSLLILTFFAFILSTAGGLGINKIGFLKPKLFMLSYILGFVSIIGMAVSNEWYFYHLAVLTILLITFLLDVRLLILMTLLLLPFYRVYTEQVHLSYVIIPYSILIGLVLETTLNKLGHYNSVIKAMITSIVYCGITIGFLDSVINPFAVRSVMTNITKGEEIVASSLQPLIGQRPVAIISNAIHSDDLKIFLNGEYLIYKTIRLGHQDTDHVIDSKETLSTFLTKNFGKYDIYFLHINYDYLPVKSIYHQLHFVTNNIAKTHYLGSLHKTRVDYFTPDPLRIVSKREFSTFVGPPDLENDFYRGVSEIPFYRKVEANYELYKVVSDSLNH